MPIKKKKPKISIANLTEIKKTAGGFSTKLKALMRRRGLGGIRGFKPIIILDPDNPGEVKICYEIVVKNEDGSFFVMCICENSFDLDFCTRTEV